MTGTAEATATHVVSRDGTDIGYWTTGDAPGYDLAREFEDVVAVVDAVAEASGSAVDLYGHSFGGLCAYGVATLTANVRRLVLYEGWPPVDRPRASSRRASANGWTRCWPRGTTTRSSRPCS